MCLVNDRTGKKPNLRTSEPFRKKVRLTEPEPPNLRTFFFLIKIVFFPKKNDLFYAKIPFFSLLTLLIYYSLIAFYVFGLLLNEKQITYP